MKSKADGSLYIASGLTSLGFLITVFLAYMAYRWFEVYTLMSNVLPVSGEMNRNIASILFATVAVSVTLILMVHTNLLSPIKIKTREGDRYQGDVSPTYKNLYWSKLLLIAISFIINYFFWEVWSTELPKGITMPPEQAKSFKWFICSLNAAFDYGLAHLFDALSKRSRKQQDLTSLEEKEKELNEKMLKAESALTQTIHRQKQIEEDFAQRTCDDCGYVAKTKIGLNSHKCTIKTINQ